MVHAMNEPLLRLLIEVTISDEGTHLVRLRSGEQAMDSGPLNVNDLPLILTALVSDDSDPAALAVQQA